MKKHVIVKRNGEPRMNPRMWSRFWISVFPRMHQTSSYIWNNSLWEIQKLGEWLLHNYYPLPLSPQCWVVYKKHQSPRFLLEGVWLHTLPAAAWGSSFYLAYIYDWGGEREKTQRKKKKMKDKTLQQIKHKC